MLIEHPLSGEKAFADLGKICGFIAKRTEEFIRLCTEPATPPTDVITVYTLDRIRKYVRAL